jgi:hypothetical protein
MLIEIAGEVQLRTYGQFLDEYGTQLRGIEDALEDSMCGSWDMDLDPISLQVIYIYIYIYFFLEGPYAELVSVQLTVLMTQVLCKWWIVVCVNM